MTNSFQNENTFGLGRVYVLGMGMMNFFLVSIGKIWPSLLLFEVLKISN